MTGSTTVLRTPDARFADLPDFGFEPRYISINHPTYGPLRMHRVDEGPKDAPVVLMLHGEPTWSFLYRKMILPVAAAGYRAVAPDYIGFGRSDKLPNRADYTYQGFVDRMRQFIETLDLRHITLVCQDWGGPIGLRLLADMEDRFDAVLATNTLLPNCEAPPRGVAGWPGEIIENWAKTCRDSDDLPVAEIVAGVGVTRPDPAILRAYDAPFPDATYKAGVLQITGLIPRTSDMPEVIENRKAWEVLERFERPFLTAFSDRDPSTKAWEEIFHNRVPGARGQPQTVVAGAGHFVQEEQGEKLAEILLDLLGRTYR